MIHHRSKEAAGRASPSHREGNLILVLSKSAIGTLVERSTRFMLLLHLDRLPDHSQELRIKNRPALAGHSAEAVRQAITRTFTSVPPQLHQSLTWDQGAEMN
ncbi:Transposase [Deinococcus deserti]